VPMMKGCILSRRVHYCLAAREHPSFGYELDQQECRARARTP
jgi:hypothetical protein